MPEQSKLGHYLDFVHFLLGPPQRMAKSSLRKPTRLRSDPPPPAFDSKIRLPKDLDSNRDTPLIRIPFPRY